MRKSISILNWDYYYFQLSLEATMAIALSSSSTITSITLQPKLKTIHGLGTVLPGYSVKSHFRSVSLRRSAVVVSAITGASSGELKCLLFLYYIEYGDSRLLTRLY